jgi:hypothetical protein
MTVAQASSYLGISAEAVRARIQRGTLEHTKEGKTVYVLLPDDRTRHNGQPDEHHDERHNGDRAQQHNGRHDADRTVLVEDLREQVRYLREVVGTRDRELETRAEELAEMRRIVAGLVQRVPELEPAREAASEPTGAPLSHSYDDEGGTSADDEGARERPSWFRRFFGFEG